MIFYVTLLQDKEQERRIKMYIANSEQNEKIPESTEVLVSLCECVIDYQRTASEDGPIVFACRFVYL